MSVTKSLPNNIKSPIGNALALYKDPTTGALFIKDINGKIEKLSINGNGVTSTNIPFEIIAENGVTDDYNSLSDCAEITWSGGTGDYFLRLPSATNIPYRLIRFVNDGTVGANNRINILVQSGETIDGVSSYVINKAYNGATVWSDGTQWIIIQAKAT